MSARLLFLSAIVTVGFSLCLQPLAAQDADKKPASVEPIGYFLGFSEGQHMVQNGFQASDFQIDAFVAGFVDALSKKEPALTADQLQETQGKIRALMQERQAVLAKARQKIGAEQKAEGEKWLAENAKKKGVKTLEKGLQYEIITAGKGASPAATDTVRVHYTGKLLNGDVFDSSVQRDEPAEFPVGEVIPGWTMALQKMKVGSKWKLYIPSDLAYGERGRPPMISPNSVLIFEVELLKIL